MASVASGNPTKDGKPTWLAKWSENVGGKRVQRSKTFRKASDAKAHARKMEVEVEERGVGGGHAFTMEVFLRRWLATLKDRGENSVTTIRGYRDKLDLIIPHIGHIRLDKLSTRDCDELYAALLARGGRSRRKNKDGLYDPAPLSPRTVLHAHRVLHTALEAARRWNFVSRNAASDAKAPSVRKSKARHYTQEEIGRIMAALDKAKEENKEGYPGLDLVVTVLLTSGIRRSEMLGLAFDTVDFKAQTITIRRSVVVDDDGRVILREDEVKTDESYRVITMPAEVMDMLLKRKAWIAEQKLLWGRDYFDGPLLVFPDAGGYPYSPDAMTRRLRQVNRRAKVKGQPAHGHRHSMATHLLVGEKMDVKTVSSRLGHSSVAITLDLYTHALEESDRAAANAMAGIINNATKMQREP
ncbi:site-specific integrase [Ensifer sp. IC4062]|nr:site-specific integrase [Ensifer sp. IC4062]MCA1444713.1 site-specific integrase [Ensifer sp. IC4062]